MSRKSKGTNAERDLVHRFWSKGWPCVRVAGSGCSRYPSPDIIAGNKERMVAIECKTTKDNSKYFPKEEIRLLREFSTQIGAEPWVGIRFGREDWFFLSLDDLKDTGECLMASLDLARQKGLITDELIGIFKQEPRDDNV